MMEDDKKNGTAHKIKYSAFCVGAQDITCTNEIMNMSSLPGEVGRDQIAATISLADKMGLETEFDYTVGPLASKRTEEDLRRVLGDRTMSANIDLISYQV